MNDGKVFEPKVSVMKILFLFALILSFSSIQGSDLEENDKEKINKKFNHTKDLTWEETKEIRTMAGIGATLFAPVLVVSGTPKAGVLCGFVGLCILGYGFYEDISKNGLNKTLENYKNYFSATVDDAVEK